MDKEKKYSETVSKIIGLRERSINGRSRAIERAKEVKTYIEHEPYTEAEKDKARENAKPLLRYNILISKLQTILGNEQANRRKVKIMSDNFGDEEVTQLLSDHFEYLEEKEQLDTKLLRFLADGLLYDTGGWIRRIVDIDDLGYATFRYKNYDSFMVHPDKEFKDMDLEDCKYIIIDDWKTIDEIKNKFGVSDLAEKDLKSWWQEVSDGFNIKDMGSQPDNEYKIGDRFLVCQLEERREVPVDIVEADGQIYKLTDEEVKAAKKQGLKLNFMRRASDSRIKFTTVVPYFEKMVLQDEYTKLPVNNFSMFYCTSFDWNMRKCDQPSWGYLLLDPQDRINKGKSQEVDYMIQRLGGSWHVQEGEKKAIDALKESAGDPNAIIPYRTLKNKAVRESGQADGASVQVVQNGIYADMNFMEEISNVTQALQGKGGKSAESGRLFDMKREQSLVSSNPFYEIKSKANERIVRDFLKCVPEVYFEDDRILPLNHNGGLRYEMVNLQLGEDVLRDIRKIALRAELDSRENVPSKLERTFNENVAFAQMLINAGYPPEQIPFMLIVKHSTIRDKQGWMEALDRSQRVLQRREVMKEANEELAQEMQLQEMQKAEGEK